MTLGSAAEAIFVLSHLVVFLGCFSFGIFSIPKLSKIVKLSTATIIAGFMTCICLGISAFGLMLGLYQGRYAPWYLLVADGLAAVSLLSYQWLIYWDVRNSVERITEAIIDVHEKIGGKLGWWVTRRYNAALRGLDWDREKNADI